MNAIELLRSARRIVLRMAETTGAEYDSAQRELHTLLMSEPVDAALRAAPAQTEPLPYSYDELRHRYAWLLGSLAGMVEAHENDHTPQYRAEAIRDAKAMLIDARGSTVQAALPVAQPSAEWLDEAMRLADEYAEAERRALTEAEFDPLADRAALAAHLDKLK